MFAPGDVVLFLSDIAGKGKFHVCVSLNGCYLFLNTPRKPFAGDFRFPCKEVPFLDATASDFSVIACNRLIRMTEAELRRCRALKKGKLSTALMHQLIAHIENSIVLTQAEKDEVLDGLGDWF